MQATIHGLLLEITEVIHVIRIAINQILTSRYPYCILLLMRGRVIHLMGLLMIGLSGALVYVPLQQNLWGDSGSGRRPNV